ncbi:MATE family efflux transporter [Streptomyces sp. NPDC006733]|uniref:MATE family efflux transporter n=1 Tax=Streptomyces sp. NPDC006733 TaxID=3155460 RepID=UPI0033ED90FC
MKRGRLVSLAVPVYFELLAGVVAGIIDVLWVAALGGAAVAAVAVATNVENVLLGVIMMAASGTTVLVAHAAGARDPGAVRSAVRGGWALFALVTPAVAVGGWLLREPLARLVLGGHEGDVLALTVGYFAISLPGVAVFFAQNLLDGILKGAGDTRTPMGLSFLGNGLILVLDPLLIHGLLGLPPLGVRGAALATVLGRSVALAVGLAALRRNRLLREAARADPAHGTAQALRRTAATGLPISGDFLVRMVGSLAMVAIVARLGVSSVAAYGIATKAMYVATMAFYAVRQAAAILTAHALGAGRDQRSAIGRQAVLTGGALGAGAALTLLVAAPWVMAAFGAQGEVAWAGTLFLRCLGPYLVLLACFIALGGVFQGGGASRQLVRVTLVGVAVQLPLAYGLSGWGLPGICSAMALSAALQCAAVAGLFLRLTRRREDSVRTRIAALR